LLRGCGFWKKRRLGLGIFALFAKKMRKCGNVEMSKCGNEEMWK